MEAAYRIWPKKWLPPFKNSAAQRLAFMFGSPFIRENIPDSLYNETLLQQFGSMHITLYLHAGQNVRRGFLAPFNSPSTRRALGSAKNQPGLLHYFNIDEFKKYRILLLTGAENQLWHRDSIDRMYEWLRRAGGAAQFKKLVLPGYGHQDLYWGEGARTDVFPHIVRALSPSLGAETSMMGGVPRVSYIRELGTSPKSAVGSSRR
jgi:hypothetical protein